MKYVAFISYKHSATSRPHAEQIESALKRYAKPLLKPPIAIFRDERVLRPGDDLPTQIRSALEESQFLIYLASREAAESKWVCDELGIWCTDLGRAERLVIVHIADRICLELERKQIDWNKTDSIPELLKPYLRSIPIWSDLSWATAPEQRDLQNIEYKKEINAIVARFRGKTPGSMNDEEVVNHRRNILLRNASIGIVLVFALLVAFFGDRARRKGDEAVVAGAKAEKARVEAEKARVEAETARTQERQQRINAEEQARIALARQLAAQASSTLGERASDLHVAALLALEAAQRAPVHEAAHILRRIESLMPYPVFERERLGPVNAIAVSPDGRKLAIATGSVNTEYDPGEIEYLALDATAYYASRPRAAILDLRTGKVLYDLTGDSLGEWNLLAVAFSPDGRTVLFGSARGTASLYEVATGRKLWQVRVGADVRALAFARDGSAAIVAGQAVRIIDPAGRELLVLQHDANVSTVAFSPDGKRLATGSNGARVFEAVSGKELLRLAQGGAVTRVVFNTDGTLLATASEDHTARVFDMTGKECARFVHDDDVVSVNFSPTADWVVTASSDHSAGVFDARSGQLIARVTHDSSVITALFSPDGQRLLTAGGDMTARIWQASSGRELLRIVHDDAVGVAAFAPDGSTVSTGSRDGSVKVFRAEDRMPVGAEVDSSDALALDDRAEAMLTADGKGLTRIFNATTGHLMHRFSQEAFATAIAGSPDRHHLLMGRFNVVMLDARNQVMWSHSLKTDADTINREVTRLSFDSTGRRIAVGTDYRDIHVLGGRSGKPVWIGEVRSGKPRRVGYTHERITAVALSPDGQYLAFGVDDGFAGVLDIARDKLLFRTDFEHAVAASAFSPDGGLVVFGGEDRVAKVFPRTGGEPTVIPQDDEILAVAFSNDGAIIATGSEDHTARLFDVKSGQETDRIRLGGPVRAVRFSTDGRELRTLSMVPLGGPFTATVDRILLRNQELITETCRKLKSRRLTQAEWTRFIGSAAAYHDSCKSVL